MDNDFYILAIMNKTEIESLLIASFYYTDKLNQAKRFYRHDEAQAYKKFVFDELKLPLSIIHIQIEQ